MPRKPVIAVIGYGRETDVACADARELGRLIAENGWILITGGRNAGVMKAANEGAKEVEGSLTLGILPNAKADISPSVDVAIITDTGEARNNIIVLSADVVVACRVEGAGTASEVALAIKNGRYVILLAASEPAASFFVEIDGDRMLFANSPTEAVVQIRSILG